MLTHSASNSLSFSLSSSSCHAARIRHPASTRYAVLYGLPVSLIPPLTAFWRDLFLLLAFFETLDENPEHDDGITFVVYPDASAISVPIVRISKSPSPRGFVSVPAVIGRHTPVCR